MTRDDRTAVYDLIWQNVTLCTSRLRRDALGATSARAERLERRADREESYGLLAIDLLHSAEVESPRLLTRGRAAVNPRRPHGCDHQTRGGAYCQRVYGHKGAHGYNCGDEHCCGDHTWLDGSCEVES